MGVYCQWFNTRREEDLEININSSDRNKYILVRVLLKVEYEKIALTISYDQTWSGWQWYLIEISFHDNCDMILPVIRAPVPGIYT